MVKLIALLLIPGMLSAQTIRKKRAAIQSRYDSIPMQYTLQNVMFRDSITERINIATIRNGNSIGFPQDSVKLPAYIGRSTGLPDTLMYINKGNVLTSAKSNLTLNYSQVDGGRAYTRPARTLNNVFTPNASRDAFVCYTISITASMSVSSGQTGAVFLEVSANNSTWVEAARVSNSNSGTLAVGLNLSNTQIATVSGIVPAGYFVRLRSTGTATIAYLNGIETPL